MRPTRVVTPVISFLLVFAFIASATERTTAEAVPFEKYLPDSTMMVLSVTDVGALRDQLSDPKLQRIFELVGLSSILDEFHNTIAEEFSDETGMDPAAMLDALTGDITLAFLDSSFMELPPKIVVFAKVDPERFPFQELVDLAIKQEGEDSAEFQDMGGVPVLVVGKQAAFAQKGDHVFLASSPDAMRAALKPEKALADSPMFSRHREMTKMSSGVVAYVNVAMFLERLKPFLPSPDSEKGREVDLFFEMFGLKQITSVSLMASFKENEPFRLFIHAPGYNGIITKFLSDEPVGFECAGYVPADFESYFAISIKKPSDIFTTILEIAEQFNPAMKAADFDANIKPIEDELGISFRDDLIAPLGTRIGAGVWLDPEAEMNIFAGPEEIFNFFRFEVFLTLDDPDRFLTAMQAIAAASNGMLAVENYRSATIFSAQPPTMPFSVDFAVHGNSLLFCLGTELLKNIIDATESGNTLDTSTEFKERTARVSDNAWYISYTSDAYLQKFIRGFFKQILMIKSGDEDSASTLIEAILDFTGEHTGGVAFSFAAADGLYFEALMPMRAGIAMFPVYYSWFTLGSLDEEIDWELQEEEEPEGAEPPGVLEPR